MRRTFVTRILVVAVTVALASASGRAHSIPTHKNLTTAAVNWLLAAQPKLQCTGTGKDTLTRALLYGTEHEDDNYENSSSASRMGRYMFHFLPVLNDDLAIIQLPSIKVGPVDLELGKYPVGVVKTDSCTSRDWGGFDSSSPGSKTCTYHLTAVEQYSITNDNTWGNALAAASRANGSYGGFSDGFVKLGYVLHLVEDQSSPAHALGASHGHYAIKLDFLSGLDPALKGATLDLGFADPMEAAPDGGEAQRDVPPSLWPPANASQLLDAAPADILMAMHNKVVSLGYKRDKMSVRSATIFDNAVKNLVTQLPTLAKGLGLPWPLGNETAAEELAQLKKNIARVIQTELKAEAVKEHAYVRQNIQANNEFNTLAPEAVRLTASLLWKYINTANPVMGTGANSCTVSK
jgi:hypothetical protein